MHKKLGTHFVKDLLSYKYIGVVLTWIYLHEICVVLTWIYLHEICVVLTWIYLHEICKV